MIYTFNIAFIVNLGNAKSSDVYEIVTKVENIMKSKYNIDIMREVVVLGFFSWNYFKVIIILITVIKIKYKLNFDIIL